jgi:hypothetical protein
MKEIKKADKSDSESDYDVRLGHEFSEDELSGDERDQMQGGILNAIRDFKHYFKHGGPPKDVKVRAKKGKRNFKSIERALADRLGVKQDAEGFAFQNKQTGNGGCCVSLAAQGKQKETA